MYDKAFKGRLNDVPITVYIGIEEMHNDSVSTIQSLGLFVDHYLKKHEVNIFWTCNRLETRKLEHACVFMLGIANRFSVVYLHCT